MYRFYSFMILLTISTSAWSQTFGEAVRYSLFNSSGTARTSGVGGAFGAMGGDFGSLSINPAGIGQFYKSEFNFTPSLSFYESEAYIKTLGSGTLTKRSRSSFSLDNLGLVIHSNPNSASWTSSNFVIGFNKIADLTNIFEYNGDTQGSITERFVERANGKTLDELDDFEAWPAYKTGAIFDSNKDKNYERDIDNTNLVSKNQIVNQNGSIHELSIGWGGNIDNKLNVGATIGVPFVSFKEDKFYTENADDDFLPRFNTLKYEEFLNTSGAGINIKAGFVYKPVNPVRIGVAFHTPTWYTLTDDYYTQAAYNYTDTITHFNEHTSPDGSFKYNLKTPMRIFGSVGTLYKLSENVQGFANVDVEWQDYGSNEFDFTEYSSDPSERQYTQEVNNDINRYLGQTLNVRIGTELAIQKLRLRAGYETGQSPYNAESIRINKLSFGIGFREENFFIDFGLGMSNFAQGYQTYTVVDKDRDPLVQVNENRTRAMMTIGFKF